MPASLIHLINKYLLSYMPGLVLGDGVHPRMKCISFIRGAFILVRLCYNKSLPILQITKSTGSSFKATFVLPSPAWLRLNCSFIPGIKSIERTSFIQILMETIIMLIKSVLASEAIYCLRDMCFIVSKILQYLRAKKKKGRLQNELTLIGHMVYIKNYMLST